jgi:hypothetical protein
MEEIIIRLITEADIDYVNEFYNRNYNATRTKEKFLWEFMGSPSGPAIYVVAIDSNKNLIVGTQCAIPYQIKTAGGTILLTAKSEDTLVDASYRGQRIFERMYELLFEECKKRGIQCIWGFTYAIKPFKKINFEIPFHSNFGFIAVNILESYKILISLKGKRSIEEKVKLGLFTTTSWTLFKLKTLFLPSFNKLETLVSPHPPHDLNFLLTSENHEAFHLNQNEHFLSWRIHSNPYNKHLHYSLKNSNGLLIANIICSIHDMGVAYIMQLAFDKTLNKSDRLNFVNYVIRQLSKKEFLIRYWGFENTNEGFSEIDLLKQAGFTFSQRGISFVWREILPSILDSTNFRLSRLASQSNF